MMERWKIHRILFRFRSAYRNVRLYWVTILFVTLFSPGHADDLPDYARETRIAAEIEPYIFDGEAIWLNTPQRPFLSIFTEADKPEGAVVILHGRDTHPEESNVAGPIRIGLAEAGWSTLALQMPVLEKGKTYYDYLPILPFAHARIESGLAFLREQGYQTVVLVAHSCGAHMANDWLNQSGEEAIDGYVAIGLGVTDAGQDLKTPFPIDRMTVPVLDIYGSEEYPRPLAMVSKRAEMLRKNGHPDSAQEVIEGAGHFFRDYGEALTRKVAVWLNQVAF